MNPHLALSQTQMWIVVVGILSPTVAYCLNNKLLRRVWESLPEPVAGMIHLLVAAAAAGAYEAVETSQLGWNAATAQYILTAVVASFVAHGIIWKPTGVQATLTRTPTARWRWQRVPVAAQGQNAPSPARTSPMVGEEGK